MGWIPLEELKEKNLDEVNTIHVDTRDFHASVLEEKVDFNKDPDKVHSFDAVRKLLKHKSNSCKIKQSELVDWLVKLYEMSGGAGVWRHLSFRGMNEPWFKYIRLYRLDKEYFLVCGQYNIPENPQMCTEKNLKKEYLCHH